MANANTVPMGTVLAYYNETGDSYPTPEELSPEAVSHYLRKRMWREQHVMERESYTDSTFRSFLSTNEWTPEHSHRKNCGKCRTCHASCRRYCACAKRRKETAPSSLKSVPHEDIVYTLLCTDAPIAFGRRALMILSAAHRAGRINVRNCTTADVHAIIGGAL